jgi:predicted ATPase
VVELGRISDPGLVPEAVAEVLRVQERPGQDLADTLGAFLEGRELLLVLDNCEHLVEAVASLVQPLLATAPAMRVLATGREPLGAVGEVLYPVEPMPVPEPDETDPEVMARHDALRLFGARAEAIDQAFRLTEETVPPVAEICRRVDGLPLAIELVVGRLRGMALEELIVLLGNRAALLGSEARGPDARHRTLRAALEWSYDLLSTVEQQALETTGVFQDTFDLSAFRAVALPDETETAANNGHGQPTPTYPLEHAWVTAERHGGHGNRWSLATRLPAAPPTGGEPHRQGPSPLT